MENLVNEDSEVVEFRQIKRTSKPKSARRQSTTTLEDLPDHLRLELYKERTNFIMEKLKKIVIDELEINPDDLIDPYLSIIIFD